MRQLEASDFSDKKINDEIRELRVMKAEVERIAEQFGLQGGTGVKQLSLITCGGYDEQEQEEVLIRGEQTMYQGSESQFMIDCDVQDYDIDGGGSGGGEDDGSLNHRYIPSNF